MLAARASIIFLVLSFSATEGATPVPPRAAVIPHEVRTEFGAVRSDPHFWLRDDTRSDPRILDYLQAENTYTDSVLEPLSALRAQVRTELTARVPPQDSSVPYLEKGYWYYSRFDSAHEYPVLARKKQTLSASEEILLNEPERAPRSGYFSVGNWAVSPNGRFLAWTEDRVGRLQYELHVKDLKSGVVLRDTASGLSSNILWGGDNQTILYVVNNKELRPRWLKAHVLGSSSEKDSLIYDERDDTVYSMLVRTNDKEFLCLDGFSIVSSEWRCAALSAPTHFQVIAPRESGHLYDLDHAGRTWYVRTNWNAPNYKIMKVSDANLGRGRAGWKDLVPANSDSLIEGIRAFDGYLAIEERFEANKRLTILTADGRNYAVPAETPAFAMSLARDQDSSGRWVRYDYEALDTPTVTCEINVDSGEQRILKKKAVAGFDGSQYVTERIWITARDGARIPVSLLHKKDWKKDGSGGLFQYAYGAYAYSVDPKFIDYAISLVDRGVVFAIAHVRGGQEMGRAWYDEGHSLQKMNTFNDFVDVTRGLVARGYAAKNRVTALGGSGGGTLMGGIANMAPDEYRAILAIVPYVDAVTTMLDPTIPLVAREYDEWGNPNNKIDYEYMLTWSPYDNVAPHPYPAMYVYTGLWDSQVQYYEPTKWVAKLRATKTDQNLLVLRTNMQGGHGGSAGRFQQIDARAEYLAFALWEMGYRQ